MKSGPTKTVSLCPDCSACPEVLIYEDGTVRIGEERNVVTLGRAEWNELVRAIKGGSLEQV